MRATTVSREQIQAAWGDPLKVAQAAITELTLFLHVRQMKFTRLREDKILEIGILLGETQNNVTPVIFFRRFEEEVLNV